MNTRLTAEYQLTNPDEAVASLTITMPIGDWRAFLDQLNASDRSFGFPCWKVNELVRDLVRRANEKFSAVSEEN